MQYLRNPLLNEADLLADPFAQFQRWFDDAQQAQLVEPSAMALATVGASGRPSLRVVLFKGQIGDGFSFYTNYESRKAQDLADSPAAAATFWWDRLERQVRIEGAVERLSRVHSEAYHRSRPRGSQLGALTSRQSRPVPSRAEVDARLQENELRYAGQDIPLPDFWGGYRLVPDYFEFWQGQRDRLHDRITYRLAEDGWTIGRIEA